MGEKFARERIAQICKDAYYKPVTVVHISILFVLFCFFLRATADKTINRVSCSYASDFRTHKIKNDDVSLRVFM